MNPDVKKVLDATKEAMDKAIQHTGGELNKIRAGKAMPSMMDPIFIDYYGTRTPMSQVANISTPDARTIVIQPWEKNLITEIEKAITYANMGFNPTNDGQLVRITIPPLTEERRKDLVKQTKGEAEHGKVIVRNLRKDANEQIKKMQKDGLPEDEAKEAEAKVQILTDDYIKKIDQLLEAKEKEILTV